MLSWTFTPAAWSFDVSSLIILVGESEEIKYRLSQRSLLECVAAAPVIGLQSYVRSYDLLLDVGSLNYFNPYGCNTAPLRNTRLQNAIEVQKLLHDGRYNVYSIPPASPDRPPGAPRGSGHAICLVLMSLWVIFTWLFFGGLMMFLFLVGTTWIGLVNCVILLAWSVVIRAMEYFLIRPAPSTETNKPQDQDAVFILGRRQSAFVLEGSRQDVKNWTGRGLAYDGDSQSPIPAPVCQAFTRIVSFFVLILIFTTIPNGSTMDQTAFILFNVLGQVNVLIGRGLNSWACLGGLVLQPESDQTVAGRTEIYGLLVRKFKDIGRADGAWINASGMLPKTDAWEEWKNRVVDAGVKNPKQIYKDAYRELHGHWRLPGGPGSIVAKQPSVASSEPCAAS